MIFQKTNYGAPYLSRTDTPEERDFESRVYQFRQWGKWLIVANYSFF